jgi:universal stress protein E
MHEFRKILFVSQGFADETEAMKQAMSLAFNNTAQLDGLIICPELPSRMAEHRDRYEGSLKKALEDAAATVRVTLGDGRHDGLRTIEVERGNAQAVRVIRHALRHAHDLIIKQAEPREDKHGFNAVDMGLLRKSHCPLWLCRPITRHHGEMKVAVAIDPVTSEENERDLALRLLRLARALADDCSGELHIVSCWDYANEAYLRNNVWIHVPPEELADIIEQKRSGHLHALSDLVEAAGIEGRCRVHHLRGQPERRIPIFIDEESVDILVMGTLARTGIPGFVIGNTAENIVQKLACSVLALKPNGFVSPVNAY